MVIVEPPDYYVNPTVAEFEVGLTNMYTFATCYVDLYSIDNASYIFVDRPMNGSYSPHYAFYGQQYPSYYTSIGWEYGYGSFSAIYECYDAKGQSLTGTKNFQVLSEAPTYAFEVIPSSDEFDCSYGEICYRQYTIRNYGTADLTITISSDRVWIQPQVNEVFVAAGTEQSVTVAYDSSYGNVGETLSGNLIFHEDHVGDVYVGVTMHVVGVYVPAIGDVNLIDVYPKDPILGKEFVIVVTVKNLDTVTRSFKLGLTVGEDYEKAGTFWALYGDHWCNSECYVSVNGTNVSIVTYPPTEDYPNGERWIEIYDVAPSEQRTIYITMKAKEFDTHTRQGFFGGEVLDLVIALRDYDDITILYDWIEKDDFITIREGIIFAYPIKVVVDKQEVNIGDKITVRAWVLNNGTWSWNFTLGISIGMWDAVNDTIYYFPQPYVVPPCNRECYRDGRGDWIFMYIPPDHTSYFERTLMVPQYFVPNTSYDVVVGIWKEPPDGDLTKAISFRYFKGVFKTLEPVTPTEEQVGNYLRDSLNLMVSSFSIGFGVDVNTAKYIFWGIVTTISTVAVGYYIKNNVAILFTIILLLAVGMIIGYFPIWLGIILIIISAFLLTIIFREAF